MKPIFHSLTALLLAFLIGFQLLVAQHVTINNPGDLYSGYELKDNPNAVAALNAQGFSAAEQKAIFLLAKEGGWPEGINSFEERMAVQNELKRLNGTLLTSFDDKYLVKFTAEDNGHMPLNMRPKPVFYMVFNKQGIGLDQPDSPALSYTRWPARIVDSGQLYSTYRIAEKPEVLASLESKLSGALIEDIKNYSNEGSWPELMNTLDGRNSIRPQIADYTVYALAFVDDSWILEVPVAENQGMPDGLKPDRDFYLIIGESGVSVNQEHPLTITKQPRSQSLVQNTQPSQPAIYQPNNFQEQVVAIYGTGIDAFTSLKGAKIEEEEGSLSLIDRYESKIKIEGADRTEVYESLLGHNKSVIADFGEFTKYEEAVAMQQKLVAQMATVKMPYCSLVQNEIDLENIVSSYYLPFDLGGEMDERLKDNLIEVKIVKTLGISDNFEMYDVWNVYLAFSKQED